MGYGKFQYTREGVTHARGISPMMTTGGAITSLNSPSDLEIFWSPSPHTASPSDSLTQADSVLHYGERRSAILVLVIPPSIWFVASSRFEHAETDACDGAGNGMSGVVLSNSLSQEMIVVLADRVLTVDGGKGGSFVDRFEHPAVAWFAPAIAASATELLVFDESAITVVLSRRGEAPCIHHTGENFHRSDGADAGKLSLKADQRGAAGNVAEAPFIFFLARAVEFDVFRENPIDERGGFPFVPVSELERRLLVEEANTGAHNILVAADEKPELV